MPISYPSFNYVKIHKLDNNGFDNSIALGQATRLRIKYDTEPGYLTIGDILTKTEYPTYWLYKVQSLGSTTADNHIIDYRISASFSSSTFGFPFTLNPAIGGKLFPYHTTSSNNQFFNQTDGIYTIPSSPPRPSNIFFNLSSSLFISASIGGDFYFMLLKPGLPESEATFLIDPFTNNFIQGSWEAGGEDPTFFGIVSASGKFIANPGDRIFLAGTKDGEIPCRVLSGSFLVTQSIASSSKEYDSVIIEPYITEPNFYNSDNNALLNSVSDQRENSFALDADYTYGIPTPINFGLLISGTATPSTVPDSNYTSKKSTLLKYEGSKSTSQLLNTWTQGDTGTYGKLPTVESLKTYIAYCDGINGWPPEHENASAMNVIYLIKADGTVVIPNTSKDSLSIMQQTFQTGERVIINTKNGSTSPLNPYRTVIRGGSHIEPILYTQSGSAPNAKFSGSILLQDVDLTNGKVTSDKSQDYVGNQSSVTNISDFSSLNLPLISIINQNNVPISTDPLFGKGYTVQSITITEGCNLIFTPQFAVSNYSTYPGLTFKISLYKSTTTPGLSTFIASTTSTGTVQNSSTQIYNTSFTVPNSDLEASTIYYIQIQITSLGSPFANFSSGGPVTINGGAMGLKVAQYPTFITSFSSSGYNTIWGYGNKVTYPYIITSSKPQLTDYFENPEIIMKSVDGTGFNQIQLPWSIKIGDEFRFEGREDWAYMVKNIFSPAESGSGRIFQTGSIEVHFNANLPVSASSTVFNLDHFLIRRYVDDAAQNILTGFRPPGSTGPYLIKPEFVVPELNKSIDEVILDLTQKGLIT